MAKGRKTGGRKKGSRNKRTKAREAAIESSGLTPLEFMLGVLRDPKQEYEMRLDAARSAAPYVHPKLANIELTGKDKGPLEISIVRYSTAQPVGPASVPIAGVVGVGAGMSPGSGVLASPERKG